MERSHLWQTRVQYHDDPRSNWGVTFGLQQQHGLREVSNNGVHRRYPLSFRSCEPLRVPRHDTGDELLRTDSEERYAYSLYGYGSVGKRVPILGTLDSDGPAHLEPLMEG